MTKLFLKLIPLCLMVSFMGVSGQAMESLETKKEFLVVLFPGANNEMSKLRDVAPKLAQRSGKTVDCFDVMEASYPEDNNYSDKLKSHELKIEERLKQIELTGKQLILVGFSEGATAALQLGLSVMSQPVGAIMSFCGLWKLQDITNSVHSLYFAYGKNDAVIPHNAATLNWKLLKSKGGDKDTWSHKKFNKNSGHYVSEPQINIASKFTLVNLGIFKI